MSKEKRIHIDLNCDLGEWDAKDPNPVQQLRDRSIMPFVSSVNIACGGHRGDVDSLRSTMEQAAVLGVAIGLHPSFPDREGFGRVEHPWSEDLAGELRRQLNLGQQVAQELGVKIHHIKPHGALYNIAARDPVWAERLWEHWRSWDEQVMIYGLSGGVDFLVDIRPSYCAEVFADRTYEPDLNLRSRNLVGAVISDIDTFKAQLKHLVLNSKVLCTDGVYRELDVDTICLHSDTPDSVELAQLMAAKLCEWDVEVRPC